MAKSLSLPADGAPHRRVWRHVWRRALALGLVLAALVALAACARREAPPAPQSRLGVNAFLWQASLETLAFAPIASTDPVGGVISSDWYSHRSQPNERFRLTVVIQGRRLRADGVRVTVLRQARADGNSGWQTVAGSKDVPVKIENSILTRARELRIGALARQ